MKDKVSCKVVLCGDSGVGKTSLCTKMKFPEKMLNTPSTTIGAEFSVKNIECSNFILMLELWDTAGQEKYKSLCKSYFRHGQVFLLIFDVTCHTSYASLSNWINEVLDKSLSNPLLIIIGNKVDLPNRAISKAEARRFASTFNALYFEISAKDNLGLEELEGEIVKHLLPKVIIQTTKNINNANEDIINFKEEKLHKNSCCYNYLF